MYGRLAAGALAVTAGASILVVALLASLGRPASASESNSIATPDAAHVDAYSTSLALDSVGNPVVSHYGVNQDLKILHCGNPLCTVGTSISAPDTGGDVGRYSFLALDASGNPVVSYYDDSTGSLKILHCGNPNCTGGNSIATPDTGGVGLYTSLALDAAGSPVVSYRSNATGKLKVLHCGNPNCTSGNSITTPDPSGDTGYYDTSLQLDTAGSPVVAYYDGFAGDLKILHCGNPNCSSGNSIESPDTAGIVGHHPELVLDAAGNPIVAYFAIEFQDLRVLHCDDPNCAGDESSNITSPDTVDDVGRDTSIRLSASGNPVIGHRDYTSRNLKIVHCNDANCAGGDESIEVPDSDGDVGAHVSLMLRADGNPIVSYQNLTEGDLRILHCSDATCAGDKPTPPPSSTPTASPTATMTPTITPTQTPVVDRLYTLDADFDEGLVVNLNHASPNNDQLQISQPPSTFRFVNIAASGRGTMVRIDVDGGTIIGEYFTSPSGMGKDPSRTTVDQLGNVWVANRAESGTSGGVSKGSVARVGVVTGGTRSNSDGSPNPAGLYLAPPFQYSTCSDRNSDGLIKTSRGLGDIRPWTNTGGADTHGGVTTADDECIINYTRVAGTGTRTLAIDANNDLWVGGHANRTHEKLDGTTGLPVPGTQFNLGCGGYGGLLDGNGVLWSASQLASGATVLRYDTATSTGQCLAGRGNYGLGIDPTTGHIWHSSLDVSPLSLYEFDSSGTVVSSHPQPFDAQGVAVDGLGHVWMAELFQSPVGTRIWHLGPDPGNPGQYIPIGLVTGLNGTTGVAVDANGKIWASEYFGNSVSRIDPNAGALGCSGTGCGAGYRVGAVDMTVSLGAGASPYNYSDMTGFVSFGSTAPQGTWSIIVDSEQTGTGWGAVSWNTDLEQNCPQDASEREPTGSSITARVRSAESQAALAGSAYVSATNGLDVSVPNARYLQVEIRLTPNSANEGPILCDVSVKSNLEGKLAHPGDTDGDGCSDQRENGANEMLGGLRNYENPWDYYDTLGPFGSLALDGVIDLANDILSVILHYAPQGQPPYNVRFDRGPIIGAHHWERDVPDGVIDLPNDILGVILQFAHNCV